MPAILVVAAVIVEHGRVLLTQRPKNTHLETLWEFPGGKIEERESPADALVRELREEIGVECAVGDIVDVTFWPYPTRDVLLLFYRAHRTTTAEIQHLGVAAHVWATANELSTFAMPPADESVVAKVRALLTARRA